MLPPGSHRRFALVGRLLAVLLGVLLGLSTIAAASRIGGGLMIEGAALRDCIGGDQAWNHDAPGQPPPRLHASELLEDNEDESDSRRVTIDVAREQLEPSGGSQARLVFFERHHEASLRAREGHGARGPPTA